MSHRPGVLHALKDLVDVHAFGPFREWRCVARVPGLWKVDLSLIASYLVRLPALFIALDRRRLGETRSDDDSFLFGDTPWDTAARICKRAGVRADDLVLDLGCGRGKFVFLAHLLTGCRAVGVERLPTYVRVAERIRARLGLEGVCFIQGDMREADLSQATVLFANAVYFSDDLHAALVARLSTLRPGACWISVGRRLEHPRLALEGETEERFSWARVPVYFYRVLSGATDAC